jgi:hypothetical protein
MLRVLNRLKAELDAGCPGLKGTRVNADVRIPQRVLNEILASQAPMASVELQDRNVVVAKVFGVGLKATIVRVEAPLKVVLSLPVLARLALWPIRSRLPFLKVSGGDATVDLTALPQMSEYPQIIKYVRLTQLRTSPGRLLVSFELAIS